MQKFKPDELERLAIQIFEAVSVPAHEARIVASHLVEANLAGHDSHGILRVPQYVQAVKDGKVAPGWSPEIIRESASTLSLEGQKGFGQVVASYAMKQAIAKAKTHGLAAVSFCNSYHTGRIASYSLMAAEEGFVAIVMVNAGGGGQSVAPYGGLARRLATNPLSIASPSGNGAPLVLDIATSVAPEGKVRDHWLKGEQLPEGWIIDRDGRPSNDASDFYSQPGGALLPLGGAAGYKGFGLGFMVDVLAGALSGAGCCRPDVTDARDGLFMIVLDIEKFVPVEQFNAQVSGLVEHVRSCPPAQGHKGVYVPGELEHREEKRRRAEGITIEDGVWKALCDAGASAGVDCRGRSLFHSEPHHNGVPTAAI